MAKKPTPQKHVPDSSMHLKQAIIAVKQLQTFLADHGGLERALGAVAKVQELVKLTGSFDQLRQALEIVGQDSAPTEPAPQV
jgi:hypothetical protein